MKVLILLLTVFTTMNLAQAETSDYVKPQWCIPSYPLQLYVAAKNSAQEFGLAQTGAGLNELGVIRMKSYQPRKLERLNILVQYVKTSTVKGRDGFEHRVDLWQQCDQAKGQ